MESTSPKRPTLKKIEPTLENISLTDDDSDYTLYILSGGLCLTWFLFIKQCIGLSYSQLFTLIIISLFTIQSCYILYQKYVVDVDTPKTRRSGKNIRY